MQIPQTSPDFYPAALSFNKRDCLTVLKKFGVHCANAVYINKGDKVDVNQIISTIGLPCFVKPNRSGSSFGVSKVTKQADFEKALEKAFTEDDEILIETAIVGTEVSIGVYNNKEQIIALTPTEIVSETEFFDYEAKYLGKSKEITPARISEKETLLLKQEAIKIYKTLNMKGVTRSDFIIQDGIPYFIEINTNPGLSNESLVPKQVRESGLTLTQFFDILIQNVLP
jgi:D-alanine-D-alanine ligase